MIILEICQKQPFDIIAMTPRGTLGLCCVDIAQLMTHTTIYTLAFTLQLCYKPLGIQQRVTKNQKVHIQTSQLPTAKGNCLRYCHRRENHRQQIIYLFTIRCEPFSILLNKIFSFIQMFTLLRKHSSRDYFT